MVRVDSNWLLSPLLRLPGPSQLLALPFVHEGPVLRLALLAAVLKHLAPAALLQAFRLHLLPVKKAAVGAVVEQNVASVDGAHISQLFQGGKVESHLSDI